MNTVVEYRWQYCRSGTNCWKQETDASQQHASTTYKSNNDLQTSDAMTLGTTKGNLNYISKYVYTPPHPKIRFYSLLFVADPLHSELVSFQSHC